jgi:hypothetical protein
MTSHHDRKPRSFWISRVVSLKRSGGTGIPGLATITIEAEGQVGTQRP